MPWTNPTTRSAGDAILASDQNIWVNNFRMGQPVFTNEAARDAALTSPEEGMVAYLTAPTVPTAAGGNQYVPTGVSTVYNGSAWVCVTPVSSLTTNNGTTTLNGFSATLGGSPGTNPSVTLVTGTTALVTVMAALANDTTGQGAYCGVAVSGASTVAASVNQCVYNGGTGNQFILASTTYVVSMSNAGTHTFTMQYRVGGAGTATFGSRQVTVQGIA